MPPSKIHSWYELQIIYPGHTQGRKVGNTGVVANNRLKIRKSDGKYTFR